jgi:hypothetical protein
VRSVRATLRRELLAALAAAMDHENAEQIGLSRTRDARRVSVRPEPLFTGSKQ